MRALVPTRAPAAPTCQRHPYALPFPLAVRTRTPAACVPLYSRQNWWLRARMCVWGGGEMSCPAGPRLLS